MDFKTTLTNLYTCAYDNNINNLTFYYRNGLISSKYITIDTKHPKIIISNRKSYGWKIVFENFVDVEDLDYKLIGKMLDIGNVSLFDDIHLQINQSTYNIKINHSKQPPWLVGRILQLPQLANLIYLFNTTTFTEYYGIKRYTVGNIYELITKIHIDDYNIFTPRSRFAVLCHKSLEQTIKDDDVLLLTIDLTYKHTFLFADKDIQILAIFDEYEYRYITTVIENKFNTQNINEIVKNISELYKFKHDTSTEFVNKDIIYCINDPIDIHMYNIESKL